MKTLFVLFLTAALLCVGLPYLMFRQPDMPAGTDWVSPRFAVAPGDVQLLVDRTGWNTERGEAVVDQVIFDAVLEMIREADTFLVIDFFLWNPWKGAIGEDQELRALSSELAEALLHKRREQPDLPILVITDPINRSYGGDTPEFFAALQRSAIPVVFTDLSRLPDSNLLYAPPARFWRSVLQRLPEGLKQARPIANPFDPGGERFSMSQLYRLLFFKANHRKVVVAGRSDGPVELLVTSLNPADGSARHSNLALRVRGSVGLAAAESELAIAEWSAQDQPLVDDAIARIRLLLDRRPERGGDTADAIQVAWVTEGAIRTSLLGRLKSAGAGDQITMAMFYLSDRMVVDALKSAVRRGARLRLLLDANKDAFGREKNGIPNRPVAAELMALADAYPVEVRWAATRGEQFHAKAIRLRGASSDWLLLGSANLTRRNIGNSNLEANLLVESAGPVGRAFDDYFDTLWFNDGAVEYSRPYAEWEEQGVKAFINERLYRIQEATGASTF